MTTTNYAVQFWSDTETRFITWIVERTRKNADNRILDLLYTSPELTWRIKPIASELKLSH